MHVQALAQMYQRSLDWRQRCEQRYQQEREREVQDELGGCTFSPHVNRTSARMVQSGVATARRLSPAPGGGGSSGGGGQQQEEEGPQELPSTGPGSAGGQAQAPGKGTLEACHRLYRHAAEHQARAEGRLREAVRLEAESHQYRAHSPGPYRSVSPR